MKIFKKERLPNGRRYIYFCGIKVFSYQKKSKPYVQNLSRLHYKKYDDMAYDIKKNISKIPSDIDLIVGVPRSGMIPAYMMALALNKSVCSLPEFLVGQFGGHGLSRKLNTSGDIKKILIIDDTCNTGMAMKDVKEKLKSQNDKYEFVFMAVYGADDSAFQHVDIIMEMLPQPRMFQWNYLNHGFLSAAAFDIDGVLCVDPSDDENDDGEKYINFLLNARPLYIPRFKIGAIVTSILEKYRPQTEQWLKQHNIQYDKLYMFNGTADERRKFGLHAVFKAKIYKTLKQCTVFIESNPTQAEQIAQLTNKLVICSENDNIYSYKNIGGI